MQHKEANCLFAFASLQDLHLRKSHWNTSVRICSHSGSMSRIQSHYKSYLLQNSQSNVSFQPTTKDFPLCWKPFDNISSHARLWLLDLESKRLWVLFFLKFSIPMIRRGEKSWTWLLAFAENTCAILTFICTGSWLFCVNQSEHWFYPHFGQTKQVLRQITAWLCQFPSRLLKQWVDKIGWRGSSNFQ